MPETTVPCLNESFAIGMVKYGQIIYICSCLTPSGFETSTHVKDRMVTSRITNCPGMLLSLLRQSFSRLKLWLWCFSINLVGSCWGVPLSLSSSRWLSPKHLSSTVFHLEHGSSCSFVSLSKGCLFIEGVLAEPQTAQESQPAIWHKLIYDHWSQLCSCDALV